MAGSDNLAVDANAGFDRARALAYAKALAPFRLRWFEEPTDPLDLRAARGGRARSTTRRSAPARTCSPRRTCENLVRFGGLRADRDIIQIDVPQSYGIVQFSRTLEMLERRGW